MKLLKKVIGWCISFWIGYKIINEASKWGFFPPQEELRNNRAIIGK